MSLSTRLKHSTVEHIRNIVYMVLNVITLWDITVSHILTIAHFDDDTLRWVRILMITHFVENHSTRKIKHKQDELKPGNLRFGKLVMWATNHFRKSHNFSFYQCTIMGVQCLDLDFIFITSNGWSTSQEPAGWSTSQEPGEWDTKPPLSKMLRFKNWCKRVGQPPLSKIVRFM